MRRCLGAGRTRVTCVLGFLSPFTPLRHLPRSPAPRRTGCGRHKSKTGTYREVSSRLGLSDPEKSLAPHYLHGMCAVNKDENSCLYKERRGQTTPSSKAASPRQVLHLTLLEPGTFLRACQRISTFSKDSWGVSCLCQSAAVGAVSSPATRHKHGPGRLSPKWNRAGRKSP